MNEYEIEFKGVLVFIQADNEMEACKKFTEQVPVGDWESFTIKDTKEIYFGNEFKEEK
jgi:hypothetical protein